MHIAKVYSAKPDPVNPILISVEVDITKRGIPSFQIVGLADRAIDEARERVNTALRNSGYGQPKQVKTIVSLSPADTKKEGTHFDVPVALGFLLADNESGVSFVSEDKLFIGELALDGSIREVRGVLGIAKMAQETGIKELYVPDANKEEASLISDIAVIPVTNLRELIDHLSGKKNIPPHITESTIEKIYPEPEVDFLDVAGNEQTKRALLIAACGGFNICMYGAPGAGKTMLAKAFVGILPDLDYPEQIQTTMIHSYLGLTHARVTRPPMRCPHHSASAASILGGGSKLRPGEVTLAHNGVLFMDEFVEFDRRVLESLREPLEERVVRITRVGGNSVLPANFLLIAALNPPSAVYQSQGIIDPAEIKRFKKKLSGPIIDRIDIWCEIEPIDNRKLFEKSAYGQSSQELQIIVEQVRRLSKTRNNGKVNGLLTSNELLGLIQITPSAQQILESASQKMKISSRVFHKILRIALTICDMSGSSTIEEKHILEALSYRPILIE